MRRRVPQASTSRTDERTNLNARRRKDLPQLVTTDPFEQEVVNRDGGARGAPDGGFCELVVAPGYNKATRTTAGALLTLVEAQAAMGA